MKNNKILRITIFLLALLFPSFIGVNSASAATCPSGIPGRHFYDDVSRTSNYTSSLTGQSCPSGFPPGNYINTTCTMPSGYVLTIDYCMAANDSIYPTKNNNYPTPLNQDGCVERYQEQGDKNSAPALCNKSADVPSIIGDIFGKVTAPAAINKFGPGSLGISSFLSNAVILIYSIATVVLIFMLLWGAFEWLTSGGEKEKLAGAQQRILHAIIGIVLFAVAFAVISVIGQFTGFKFFAGQQ